MGIGKSVKNVLGMNLWWTSFEIPIQEQQYKYYKLVHAMDARSRPV